MESGLRGLGFVGNAITVGFAPNPEALFNPIPGFARLFLLALDQFGPDFFPVIRSKALNSDLPTGKTLYGLAVLHGNRASALDQLIDHRRGKIKKSCHFRLGANDLASNFHWGFLCFHGLSVALLYDKSSHATHLNR
jgi:hypothetical protein